MRTLEFVYLAMATLAFATLASAAGWIAAHWIKAEQLSPALIRDCVVVAAATIGLRLVGALYHGVLRGLERQVTLNLFSSALILIQTVGLASILFFVRPSLRDFFLFRWPSQPWRSPRCVISHGASCVLRNGPGRLQSRRDFGSCGKLCRR